VRDDAAPDVRQRLGAAAAALRIAPATLSVNDISLVRSDLRPAGPVYARLAQVLLHTGTTGARSAMDRHDA